MAAISQYGYTYNVSINPELIDEMKQEQDRQMFNDGLRERGYYSEVKYPADVYIAELANLPVALVPGYEGLGKTGYWKYVYFTDKDGNRRPVMQGNVIARVWVDYDNEQQETISKYWYLLSDMIKWD